MKAIVLVLAFLSLSIGVGVFVCACKNVSSSSYITGLEGYDLSEAEITNLKPKAEAGDQRSAKTLMFYYGLVKRDQTEFEYWRKIAEP